MSRRVETAVVVGRDAALWLTALSLQRAFGRVGVKVKAVELPSFLPAVEAYVTMPSMAGLHGLLGIKEDDVLSACAGVYTLGQRFANWSKSAPPFMHAYDTVGGVFENVEFVQYWTCARGKGVTRPLEDFSLGAAAAKQARIVVHNDETEAYSKAAHGYHLDARSYVSFLRARALKGGVEIHAGPVKDVERQEARFSTLTLEDGQTVSADLFVDVSIEGVLIDNLVGAGFEPWDRWLPCDRILSASGKRLSPLPGYSQVFATPAGWIGMFPLQDRTALTAVYSSRLISDRDMLNGMAGAGVGLSGDPMVTPFRAGARRSPWIGNCVALGEAAVRLEPLDAAPLQLLQIGLTHLVALFPVDADDLAEAEIYNAAVASHVRNVRDFQIAHYKLNQRPGEPFWDHLRAMPVPDELAYKIGLFASRGRVALYDDESFQESNWASIFVGHGLIPRSYDPLADRLPDTEQMQKLQGLLGFIANAVNDMPSVEAQLEISAPMQGSGFF